MPIRRMNNPQQSYQEKLMDMYGVSESRAAKKKRSRLILTLAILVGILCIVSFFGLKNMVANYGISVPYPSPALAAAEESSQQSLSQPAQILEPVVNNTESFTVQPSFIDMLKENPDTVGYISIPNTRVQYPVVQTVDNDYYMKKDFYGKSFDGGSIFMDFRNNVREIGQPNNFIIYGHHMKDDSMFATLTYYYSNTFFQSNPIIEFDTIYGNYKWEVFSAYATDVDFYYIETYFATSEDYEAFLQECKDKSKHKNDVMPTAEDTILTLSTCFYNGEGDRFVVQARLID